MADTKITGLAELTAPAFADLLAIVDDVGGTPTSKKITVANLFKVPQAAAYNDAIYSVAGYDSGLGVFGNSNVNIVSQGTGVASFKFNAGMMLKSSLQVLWSTAEINGGADIGIKRSAAGTLQVTNGSSGAGTLIFVVPTSDPGITGALWNNAGTLSISA